MNITLHSAFTRHPKFARLSDAAFRKWFALDGYCCEHLTDGIVPKTVLRELGVTPRILAELIVAPPGYDAGLLEDGGDVVIVHDFGDWNDTKTTVQAARRRLRERVRRCRDKRNGVTDDVTNGVGNGVTHPVSNGVCTEGDSGHRPPDTEQELKNGAATAARPVENSKPGPEPDPASVRVVEAIIRKEYLPVETTAGLDEGDIRERVKQSLAEFDVSCPSRAVTAAIESERFKRQRGIGRGS